MAARANNMRQASREDIRRNALGRRLDAEQTQRLIDQLVRARWLRPAEMEPSIGRPPRRWVPEQPIFYPALSEAYAVKIARDWNVAASGKGYVTRFQIADEFLARYQVQEAGGSDHREYWIPAENLGAFNEAIVGEIEIVSEY
jgi:hypothetical protein